MSAHLSHSANVAILTLDRPEAMNALNADMVARLDALLDEVEALQPHALLVVGSGSKAFCAGADIKEMLARPLEQQHAAVQAAQCVLDKLENLSCPSVAVIQGTALGGGLELALACTFRIASANARLGLPEVKLGLMPSFGGTQRLPRLVGLGRALELVASGRIMDADEAQRIGLVHALVGMDDPVRAGLAYLQTLIAIPPPASLPLALQSVRLALDMPLCWGLEQEARLFAQAVATRDAAEGMQALLARRQPVFKHR